MGREREMRNVEKCSITALVASVLPRPHLILFILTIVLNPTKILAIHDVFFSFYCNGNQFLSLQDSC